jgi:p-aminobenzoyl-glutamate transporter AbgT
VALVAFSALFATTIIIARSLTLVGLFEWQFVVVIENVVNSVVVIVSVMFLITGFTVVFYLRKIRSTRTAMRRVRPRLEFCPTS